MKWGKAVLLAVVTIMCCNQVRAETEKVYIDYGTKQVFLGHGRLYLNSALYVKSNGQNPKMVKQFAPWKARPKLLAVNESAYYAARDQVAPQLNPNDVLIIRGKSVWVYNSAGILQKLGIDGTQIKEWSGRWVTLSNSKEYFLFSVLKEDGQTATYEQLLNDNGEATQIDERFRPFVSKARSIDDIPRFWLAPQQSDFKWLPKNLGMGRLTEVEDRAKNLSTELHDRIYGQDRLIDGLTDLYKMSLMNPSKRVFTALMMGPSGTGKSYAAEEFAKDIFGSDKYVLKIDGTEYQQQMSNSFEFHKLVGAPPGQAGQQKGAITEWLKATGGNGVLVINEADKMHPEIWMRLMELLDRGEITAGDGTKYKANFLYIILTSNRGTKKIFPREIKNWTNEQLKKRVETVTTAELRELYETSQGASDRKMLPREVINRIDGWLLSQPLSDEAAVKIAQDEADVFVGQMREIGLQVEIEPQVVKYLALTNFTANDDGRQIRRAVKTHLTNLFTKVGGEKPQKSEEIVVSIFKGDKNKTYLRAKGHDVDVKLLGPQNSSQNPLYDPQVVAKLKSIPEVIGRRVIGQTEAGKSASEALIAKLGQNENDRATSFFFIGTSGNGKTEMGRAIAEAGFGSIDQATIIPLGEVQNEADFNKVLGVQPGYIGSDQPRLFEEALIAHPNGGVIIFDEASNMGGGDRARKAELFKKLYNIVDEKTWVSPVNGKVYDLSKYVFVFTGNDGEELFQGITSDDMLMKVWETYKARERVRELLLRAGVPQAFINRMADSVLMKPILSPEAEAITRKLFAQQISHYEANNSGVKVEYDEQFIRQLAESFFSKDKGGRSIRDLTDHRLNSLLTSALIDHGIPEQGFDSVKVRLELKDNGRLKPYRFSNSPKRKTEIVAQVADSNGNTSTHRIDLTEHASTRMLMDAREAMAVVYHEAGHAVVNDPKLTGKVLEYVTIRGGRAKDLMYLGYARYDLLPGRSGNMTREGALATIAQLMAGRVAQSLAGYAEDSGASNDLEQARNIATNYFIKWGLDKRLRGIRLNDNGEPVLTPEQSKLLEQKMNELIDEGENLARQYLEQNWDLVRAAAAAIIRNNGSLDGQQFESIQNSVLARENRKPFSDYVDAINRRRQLRERSSRLRPNIPCSKILTEKAS